MRSPKIWSSPGQLTWGACHELPDSKPHCFAILQTVLEEHDIVDGNIDDFSLRRDRSLIGHHEGFLNMIVFILREVVQRTVDGLVLARLHFNGDGG